MVNRGVTSELHVARLLTILDGVGWCAYAEPVGQDRADTISAGPVSVVSLGTRYILLPRADNPRSPEEIDAVRDALSPQIGLAQLTTRVLGDPASLRAFTLYPEHVTLECPPVAPWEHIDYPAFYDACSDLIPVRHAYSPSHDAPF